MYYIDYHIHSLYSEDSSASIEDIARQAMSRNIREICITDHFDLTAFDHVHRNYDPKGQKLEIEEVIDDCQGKIKIIQGIELGQPHQSEKLTCELLSTGNFDYVVGSVNKDIGGQDISGYDYRNVDVTSVITSYLNELKRMCVKGEFDCVGHFDLPRRYAARQGVFLSMLDYIEDIREIFSLMIQKSRCLEINTSGIRHNLKDFMPEFYLVKIYRDMGGVLITVGSDAHSSGHVGADIMLAYQMLKEAGFKTITTYEKRRPVQVALEERQFFRVG